MINTYTKKILLERIKGIVAEELQISIDDIEIGLGIYEHPFWDSLSHVSILVRLEEEFGLYLDEALVDRVKTIEHLVDETWRCTMKVESEMIRFKSFDGLDLYGTITKPSGYVDGLILFVHGITSDRSEWGVFDKFAQELAKNGFASLRFDYRSHGESAFPSEQLTLSGILGDIKSAWLTLSKELSHAKERSFIIGSSFGGGLAYRAATEIGGFKHAFLLAPVFDYYEDIKKSAPNCIEDIQSRKTFSYSTLELGAGILNEARSFVVVGQDPDLTATIIHGTLDDDVPISSSREMVSRHSTFKLITIEGAGHVIAVPGDLDMEDEKSWDYVNKVIENTKECIG